MCPMCGGLLLSASGGYLTAEEVDAGKIASICRACGRGFIFNASNLQPPEPQPIQAKVTEYHAK